MALVTMVVSALILTQPGVTVATESYGNAFPENSTGAPENTTGAPENSTGALENSTGGPHNQTNSLDAELPELDMFYTISEILVAIIAVIGNALTITVFAVDRKLRRLTNYYIVSLALADLLVGVLGIPFAILTAIGLPQPRWACLLMLSTLLMLCTISIFCLVAVSVDRYWAILHPLRYSRVMTAKIARRIILACWASGTLVGLLPTMGWHEHDDHGLCLFRKVMDYDYLVFLYFCTIVGPGILMAVFYTHIYTVVLKQLRQIAAQEPQADGASLGTQSSQRQRSSFFRSASRGQVSESSSTRYDQRRCSTATNLGQQVTQASRREVKAAKSLSIIVLFFMVSWFPLYTINCVQAFCKQCDVPIFLMSFTIILTHLNSAINPFLYAYHMKDFRNALKAFILHRLLRRPIDPDYGYGRTLVSANYSNIYRVNQAGSTHLPSPQPLLAYNTPPLPDTPLDELRSRSSTIGSYGPLSSNRNLSPSLSFPPSPATVMTIGDGVQELSSCASRPRAATITSHTSPASATIPLISTDESSQPLLSSSVTMNGPRQQPETNGVRRASTLPPLSSQSSDMTATSLNILPHSDRESSCEANINLTTSDTSSASALISETICNGARGDVSDAVIPEATTTTSLQTTSSNCSSLASRHKIDQKENVQSSEPWCGGGDGAARSSMYSSHTCSSTLSSSDTYSGSLAKEALLIPPCKEQLNTSTSNETLLACRAFDGTSISNQSIPICGSNEESVGMVESPELFTQQEGAAQTQIREVALADDHVVLINQTSLPIPNGSACNFSARPVDGDNCTSQSDDNSSGCDASTLPCLGSSTEEQRAKTCREEDPSCRAAAGWTTEQSRVSKELSKYLPKILRRESGLRSKNSRKNKSWWTELMRQRSYHGISLELKSSKHVDRAQSISGAIET
ncbi:uncharacterized protein [Procambarus clarkii]|uniref:uncharacterized protein isoform X6 n=1 Tax=Procambarus clarkii TaxID=6728 RepID=UPI001E674E6B|nr:serine-rich adhesin for platelets-like isoform X3 [Procambarus clarkii]